jgi:hypothetical protein
VVAFHNKYCVDPLFELQIWIGLLFIALWLAVIMLNCQGCTASQRQAIKSGLVSVGDCSIYTSIGCASQAAYDCQSPGPGESYRDYAHCVTRNSASCAGTGLARCLLGEVRGIFERSPIMTMHAVIPGRGCAGEESMTQVLACVDDVSEIDTETAAVRAVAACYREVCVKSNRLQP